MNDVPAMNKAEQLLFNAVKNQPDSTACAAVGFMVPNKELDPDAEVPNLDLKDEHGLTLLHYAVKRGMPNTVNRLLQKGASVDIKDKDGNTPLVYAMNEIPNRKIDDPNIDSGRSLNNFKVIEKLLEYKADVNAVANKKNIAGRTCVHLAVSSNNYSVIDALLSKQEPSSSCLEKTDEFGQTPFQLAVINGDKYIVDYMLNKTKANPNFQSPSGYTALHYAALNNRVNLIPALIKAGADPAIKSNTDKTPEELARKQKHFEFIDTMERETKNLKQGVPSNNSSLNFVPSYY